MKYFFMLLTLVSLGCANHPKGTSVDSEVILPQNERFVQLMNQTYALPLLVTEDTINHIYNVYEINDTLNFSFSIRNNK